jgi:hypothetical protein
MYVPGKGPGLHPSGARGPRLKSLDLPPCVSVYTYVHTYIHTYIHTPRTCSCAEPSWPLSLSCFASRLTPQALFAAQYSTYQYLCFALHCNAPHCLHCTILHCAVPWARLHSPRVLPCTIALPPTRASFSVANTPTARKRYRVHRAPSCPLPRISGHLPTNPARRRASK